MPNTPRLAIMQRKELCTCHVEHAEAIERLAAFCALSGGVRLGGGFARGSDKLGFATLRAKPVLAIRILFLEPIFAGSAQRMRDFEHRRGVPALKARGLTDRSACR